MVDFAAACSCSSYSDTKPGLPADIESSPREHTPSCATHFAGAMKLFITALSSPESAGLRPCSRREPWHFLTAFLLLAFTCAAPAHLGLTLRAQAGKPAASTTLEHASGTAQNVILVMTDGLRWQEVFRGADAHLLTKDRYYDGRSVDTLRAQYLASTPEERRQKLFPFLWGVMAAQGQIFGDRDVHSDASVINGFNFSYPGYSEVLTGHGDPRIDSNDNKPNPNITVLEWINRQPGFQSRVAAFGAWEVISGIVNQQRCGFPVNAGYAAFHMDPMTPRPELLNQWKNESPRVWDDEPFDAPAFYTAMEYLRAKKPRVMFLSLGETDDWAHAGNYGEYLESAHRVDSFLGGLWKELQSMPEYQGKTTIVFLPDHGRGSNDKEWKSHGQKLPDSKYVFIGLLGPGIFPTGLQRNTKEVHSSQVAATIARILGLDWNAAEPKAGESLVINAPKDWCRDTPPDSGVKAKSYSNAWLLALALATPARATSARQTVSLTRKGEEGGRRPVRTSAGRRLFMLPQKQDGVVCATVRTIVRPGAKSSQPSTAC